MNLMFSQKQNKTQLVNLSLIKIWKVNCVRKTGNIVLQSAFSLTVKVIHVQKYQWPPTNWLDFFKIQDLVMNKQPYVLTDILHILKTEALSMNLINLWA
jgi:hypothetical protein